ncbi:CAF17-like 4Fe-4S cluster assembly/insertion protein YgfZ [Noviherbaspirillum malthae]|jgi:folate-binding protein YgfZ|uniref:CAF17-like 4Fe-4S cluster assembly/insertion protein YgfZ n=1 Tax=Noviherbaspirillum malthae TaxID=1260987 RepID=UPI00188E3C42|nr:folate-binding protein YgfZ [Noviherbaspirillum malthae]
MNTWLQFLAANGARIDENDASVRFDGTPPAGELPRIYVAPLADQGLIGLSGDDAASFLHNQITNDVENLPQTEARLAGYCSPKGRLLASFLMWKTGEEILLQLPRQIQPPIQKRLQMYVLRAKAKLQDAGDRLALLGIGGAGSGEMLAAWFPILPAQAYAKLDSDHGSLIRLPDAFGAARYQWILPAESAANLWPEITRIAHPVGTDIWRLTEIHSGIPQITLPTQEQFVPQMINFELVGGVNFKKGCYPGQEIVARSQYLGKLKRRMLLASVAAEARAGMEVFSSADPDQPCGMVVNAAPNLQGATDMLVEIKIAAAEDASVHLGSAQGPALSFAALPYSLPA